MALASSITINHTIALLPCHDALYARSCLSQIYRKRPLGMKPTSLSFAVSPPKYPLVLRHGSESCSPVLPKLCASAASPPSPASDSTRTISAVLSSLVWATELLLNGIQKVAHRVAEISPRSHPTPEELSHINSLRGSLLCAIGPLFLTVAKDPPRGPLSTPVSVVAASMAKWLDIYRSVLMIRVMLSWFPNIPWKRQPLSAIRDLSDPYLNLFRNIIPPLLGILDLSPLLAFAVMGVLVSVLNQSVAF